MSSRTTAFGIKTILSKTFFLLKLMMHVIQLTRKRKKKQQILANLKKKLYFLKNSVKLINLERHKFNFFYSSVEGKIMSLHEND